MSPVSAALSPAPAACPVRPGPAWARERERLEKICEVRAGPSLWPGEGDTGGGGPAQVRQGTETLVRTPSQWSELSKNVEFQE